MLLEQTHDDDEFLYDRILHDAVAKISEYFQPMHKLFNTSKVMQKQVDEMREKFDSLTKTIGADELEHIISRRESYIQKRGNYASCVIDYLQLHQKYCMFCIYLKEHENAITHLLKGYNMVKPLINNIIATEDPNALSGASTVCVSEYCMTLNMLKVNYTILGKTEEAKQMEQEEDVISDWKIIPFTPRKEELIDCANCHRVQCNDDAFKRCSRCKSVLYCSDQCHRSHWKSHKTNCKIKQ
jgi:hypothetical protein